MEGNSAIAIRQKSVTHRALRRNALTRFFYTCRTVGHHGLLPFSDHFRGPWHWLGEGDTMSADPNLRHGKCRRISKPQAWEMSADIQTSGMGNVGGYPNLRHGKCRRISKPQAWEMSADIQTSGMGIGRGSVDFRWKKMSAPQNKTVRSN